MIQNTVTISFGNFSLSAVSCSVRIHLKQERICLNPNWVGFQIPKGGEPVLGPCTLALCQHFDTLETMTQEQTLFRVDSMAYNQAGERHGGENARTQPCKGPETAISSTNRYRDKEKPC